MQNCMTADLSKCPEMKKDETKQLYIVLSQTGTMLSRILKFLTGAEYNHASISLSEDLTQMYSFGRKHPYNPFWGGFVRESPYAGTFLRFSDTRIVVFELTVSAEVHREMLERLIKMYEHRKIYHYNYLGLFLAGIHIHRTKVGCYYCSEFVKAMLVDFQINGAAQLAAVVHPSDFYQLPDIKIVYQGKLREYSARCAHQSMV